MDDNGLGAWLYFSCSQITTVNGLFAECLGHSAKLLLHSAKALPSAALGKEQSAKNPSAKVSLSSATYRALGKAFAECHVSTRQKKSDVNSDGLFAECHLSGTRQRIFSFF